MIRSETKAAGRRDLKKKDRLVWQSLGIVGPLFLAHKKRLSVGFAAILIVDYLQLIIPRFMQQGVDALAQGSATGKSLLTLSSAIIVAALGVAGFRFLWRYLILGFSRILEKKIRDRLFRHLLKMDQQFYGRWSTGDLIAHAGNDLSAIQMAFGMGLVAATDAFVMSLAAIGFMAVISWKLTLYALLPMPFLALSTWYLSGHLHKRFTKVQAQFALLTEFARSTIVSVRLIQAYTLEQLQADRFDLLGRQYVKSNLVVALIQGTLFPTASLVGNIGMLLVLYKGGSLVVHNQISLGEFVAFSTYLYLLIWPIMALGWVSNVAQRGLTSLGRVYRLLREKPEIAPLAGAYPVETDQVTIHCRNLRFTYPSSKRPVLDGIDLTLRPGVLGVTGRTGSGKTTLCKVLMRVYSVEDGMLLFNGVDVNTLSAAYIRSHIGWVAQEPVLFSHSIAENIGFGKVDHTKEDIYRAAQVAAVHEDILRLPEGYASIIGERGVKLSGGQRQRIALARALISDRPVLVLDDGLNGVDVATEQQILQGICESFHAKTVLIVSHRVNVLQSAEMIVLLENGTIAARGSHAQLMAHPLYYTMVSKQQSDLFADTLQPATVRSTN
ncbi:MAG: multidrug ABC transporter ATP-binding protein [Desulfobulbus propionicus]|nr:MAG: multidrug ABC transporter ATP-binding protein [Desulfobulbus propionicus]